MPELTDKEREEYIALSRKWATGRIGRKQLLRAMELHRKAEAAKTDDFVQAYAARRAAKEA